MTVPQEQPSFTFVTDGVTTTFDIPFTWTEASDINVAVTVNGSVVSAPFSVTGTSGNSQIVFNTAPAAGTGQCWRLTPIQQQQSTPFLSGGAFPNQALAAGLDYLTRIAAEISEQTGGGGAAQAALSAAAAAAAQVLAQAADANAQTQAANALTSANSAATAAANAYSYEQGALSAQSATAVLGAVQGVLGAPATALPYCVTGISSGAATVTSGTPGTYALTVTGGPPGFAATITFTGTGSIPTYTITNAGLSTTNSAPTLALPSGITLSGSTVPTATVNTIPVGRQFWAPSSDGTQLLAWGNVGGTLTAVGSPQLDLFTASGVQAANFSLAPVTVGDISGSSNPPSGTYFAWGTTAPVQTPGLLSQVQFKMSAAATVSLLFYDLSSLTVLKVFTGIAAAAGTNTLTSANGLGQWYCPAGAMPLLIVTSGSGQHLQGTGGSYPATRFNTSAVSSLVAGNTMPAPSSIASTDPCLAVTTTPALAQNVDTRVAVLENNHMSDADSYVTREQVLSIHCLGVTTYNSAATSASTTGRILCTSPSSVGGKAISAFLNMNAAGSGELCFFKPVAGGGYYLWQAIPTGPLVAGANTVALPELDIPAGCVMGYNPVVGGQLNTQGFSQGAYWISTTGYTGIVGTTTTYTMNSGTGAGELGLTMWGPTTRYAMSGTLGQLRNADNGRIKPRLPTFFIKGVWLPPSSQMATWASRGVNTCFTDYADFVDGNGPGWLAGCAANGLYYIRRPGLYSLAIGTPAGQLASTAQLTQVASDVTNDLVNPYSLGYNTPDEPDGTITREQGTGSPTAASPLYVAREIDRWKQIDRAGPAFMNVEGFHIQYPGSTITPFFNIADVDVFGFDTYPNYANGGSASCIWWQQWDTVSTNPTHFSTVNGTNLEWMSQQLAAGYANQGPTISAGKPTYCFIATSRVASPAVPPTPGEFRCLSWSAVIGGVIGICYFPLDVTPGDFQSDASDTNVLTEMGYLHSNLAVMQSAGCLINPTVGGRIPFIKRLSAPLNATLGYTYAGTVPKDSSGNVASFRSPSGTQMQGGFEGIQITNSSGAVYYLILNLLGVTATLNDTQWGISGMSFGPYEVKFLAATALSINLFTESGL